MHPFEGFLESVHRDGDRIIARFVVGGFDPTPTEPPVLLVNAEAPENSEETFASLCRAQQYDEGAYVVSVSDQEVIVQTDHGNEIRIRGKQVTLTESQFEGRDFERLAKANRDWGKSNYVALTEHIARLHQLRRLLTEQRSRITIKLQYHEAGSTAHKLYQQQLQFLSRLLEVAGA